MEEPNNKHLYDTIREQARRGCQLELVLTEAVERMTADADLLNRPLPEEAIKARRVLEQSK